MKIKQITVRKKQDFDLVRKAIDSLSPQLILLFGAKFFFNDDLVDFYKSFPKESCGQWLGCSTAGEIYNKGVLENSLIITVINFEKTKVHATQIPIANANDSHDCGVRIADSYSGKNLKFLFLLGRGVNINGTSLLAGLYSKIAKNVIVTGGLAGDNGEFKQTLCFFNGVISDSNVVSFALEGETTQIGYGSYGGWKPFGPVRKVTRSNDNILYELDGEPALKVYKKYLGGDAVKLPAAGLRYPLAILNENEDETGIIRTILGINEVEESLTLAGDISENQNLRLMHADHSGLVEGAREAARFSNQKSNNNSNSLTLLVSCIGRKIVMGEDVDDEIDAVRDVVGDESCMAGFYSNGEFCPINKFMECKLHNQTMTITQITE